MLSTWALLFGAVLLALTVLEKPLRRLPLAPAVIYLAVGVVAGLLLDAPDNAAITDHASTLELVTELAVLVSLFAVGLRLQAPPTWHAWQAALLLAGPGMVMTVALGMAAAVVILGLPWQAALLLAAVLAPTDPVLASEVQIRSDADRDAVRLSLTAEGGLNDGTALPAVMAALGLIGLRELGPAGSRWLLQDVVWAIGGALLIGVALGRVGGALLRARSSAGDPLLRDELLYMGLVMTAFGLARLTATSTFVVTFAAGVTLLLPFRAPALAGSGQALAQRLGEFGARIERLVEAATVLAVGVALYGVRPGWQAWMFGGVLALAVRPLAVLAVLRNRHLLRSQRRLISWFGIRGIGTLYYLAFVLEQGVAGSVAAALIEASLAAVAVSIILHGVSATPLMTAYQWRRSTMSRAARAGASTDQAR